MIHMDDRCMTKDIIILIHFTVYTHFKIHFPIWEITKAAKFSKKPGKSPMKPLYSPERKLKFSQSMAKRHSLITIWSKIKNQYKKRTKTKNFLNSEVGSVLSVAGLAQAVIA